MKAENNDINENYPTTMKKLEELEKIQAKITRRAKRIVKCNILLKKSNAYLKMKLKQVRQSRSRATNLELLAQATMEIS